MSIQIVEIAQPSVIDTVAVAQPSTVAVVEVRQGPAGPAGLNEITSATTSDGTADLSISNLTTATATVSGTLTAPHIHGNLAGNVYAHVRAGEALEKGDPVYVSGSHGSGATLIAEVSKADASNAAKMPAVGIMDAAVSANANGHMVITGTITELDTAGYSINAELYVAPGGGMTATPPSARAQPVARVERSNINEGAILVKVNGLSASDATPSTLVRRTSDGGASFGPLATGSLSATAISSDTHSITSSAGTTITGPLTLSGTGSNTLAATYSNTISLTGTTGVTIAGGPLVFSLTGGILEQRYSTGLQPQTSRIYNTYTSSTSFERLNFRWDSSSGTPIAKIGTEKGSAGGVARDLVLETDGTERVRVTAAGTFSVGGVTLGRGAGAIATNTAAGFEALAANTTGLDNAVFGYRSMLVNTTGNGNAGLGSACLFKSTTGNANTAIGNFALFDNVTGSENTALGSRALLSNTGSLNTAVGRQSLTSNTTGSSNAAVGINSGRFIADGTTANTVTNNSVYLGSETKALASGQTNQIVIGHSATGLGSNTAVLGNDSITTTALKGNVVVHREAQDATNFERVGMRWDSTTAKVGTSKGGTGVARDLVLETDGTERVRVTAAGVFSVDGVTLGRGAGAVSTNTAAGSGALGVNSTGSNNSANGFQALFSNTTGASNSAFGRESLRFSVSGDNNTACGSQSFLSLSTGSRNTSLGSTAGRFIADGVTTLTSSTDGVFLGFGSRAQANGQTNQIVIGTTAIGLGSNTAVLGNDSVTTTALKGNVGIGTTSPAQKLDVVGSIKASQPIIFPSYTVGTAPTGASYTGGMAYITDEADGPTMAFYDGTNWRRVQDRAIIALAP